LKNVLLPIDFYQDPKQALKDLSAFLKGREGEFKILLLSTYMVPVSPSDRLITAHDDLRRQSLEKLKNALQTFQIFSDGKISFETISQMGLPANVIARIVPERKIDCVIVGRGTQAELVGLLHRVGCPVMIL